MIPLALLAGCPTGAVFPVSALGSCGIQSWHGGMALLKIQLYLSIYQERGRLFIRQCSGRRIQDLDRTLPTM